MTCPAFEERIARLVGDDLGPAEIRSLEDHLRQCPGCAELARLLEQDRQWLSKRPAEALAVDYAAMRSQIRQTIQQRRGTRGWAWLLAAAAAVAVMVLAAGMMRRPARQAAAALERKPAVTVTASIPAAIRASARVPARHRRVRAIRSMPGPIALEEAIRMLAELDAPPEVPQGSDSPVEIRIATGNPNVTIILLQESQGDSYE